VYDYVDGKADWMAYGLPVEGDDGPFLGDQLVEVPTCAVTGTVADAREALDASGGESVVLVHAGGLAVGEVDREALTSREGDVALLEVFDPVPTTVRPSVTAAALAEGGGGDRLVTTSDGRLLGRATVAPADHDGHDDGHDHDHEGHDHDHEGHDHEGHDHDGHGHEEAGEGVDAERFETELVEVTRAIEEHFGDRDPSPEELRAFLHARLLAEGWTVEDADRFLDQLDVDEAG
jgi:hypothetical protein